MRFFKEPLLHFFLAGTALFAVYGWLNHGIETIPAASRTVHISAGQVEWLKAMWARQWQRPPDEQELRGLLADYLKEELLAREARDLGLEDNDTIVRRRLAQKMEFLVEDTAPIAKPSEEDLQRLYDENRAQYRTPARISFTQIYFKNESAAQQALSAIAAENLSELGDSTLLARDYENEEKLTVTNQFGPEFSERVFALETGSWLGPVPSAYGFHLVRIRERRDAAERSFEKVRPAVMQDWQRSQRDKARDQFFSNLFRKYDVVVDEQVKPLLEPLVAAKEKMR